MALATGAGCSQQDQCSSGVPSYLKKVVSMDHVRERVERGQCSRHPASVQN